MAGRRQRFGCTCTLPHLQPHAHSAARKAPADERVRDHTRKKAHAALHTYARGREIYQIISPTGL